ncbi:MAG: Ig-like domain-containing protein [Burkholderiaceae bacterium]|nr:Ig-like domain-containing protein [Burkholderiaceae bacterium]
MYKTTTGLMGAFRDWLALLCCAALLAACGGGGGNPGSTTGTTGPSTTPKVTSVVLISSAETIASSGADGTEVTLSALVKDANNLVMENQTVDFKANSGNIVVVSKTTDATGTATARLNVKGDASLRTITVTATVGTIAATKNIQVVGVVAPTVPTATMTLLNSTGAASNALSSATPLTARTTVRDKDNKPVANALVTFTADANLVALSPSVGTALTDANGQADVILRPASLSVSGGGTVNAAVSVAGNTLTTSANFSVGATALSLSPLNLSSTSIAAYGSTTITVDVMAGNAKYTDQQLNIAFTSNCVTAKKATLAATVPTSNGTAQVVYRDQGCGNIDQITASASGISKASTASLNIAAPKAASIQFSAATPVDRSIVIQGQGGIGRTETATLTFKVFDTFGNALPGQKVTFTSTTTNVTINKDSDSTDANGEVITTVNSGKVPTSFRIVASLANGASTTSDSIVVTTGAPVQRAFSVSLGSPNVEGWSYDDVAATTVSVLVADQAGNPVPDGLPVVFQTNLGAIGSSDKGACNTTNGGCSVAYRAQAPRVVTDLNSPATPCNTLATGAEKNDSLRRGLATVCASTTNSTETLYRKLGIFLSGSKAENVYLSTATGAVKLSTNNITDLGTVRSTESRVFILQLNDVNNNPMPAGTTVKITSVVNAVGGGVAPAIVQNVFPHTDTVDVVAGLGLDDNNLRQGSYHQFSIGSAQAKPCLTALDGTFSVEVTTPKGNVTSYPFKLAFSCP